MERLWPRTYEEQIEYHLADGRAPEFDKGQPGRIDLARFLLEKILRAESATDLRIVELGCGAGDITGPYSVAFEVHGYDVTPAAKEACNRRWPTMNFHLKPVEEVRPFDSDILVMCEFLEHVDDPIKIVTDWATRARWVIIGHPLNEPNPPYETGHIWSYTLEDWRNWFTMSGHHIWEQYQFPMGQYDAMVMGHGSKL